MLATAAEVVEFDREGADIRSRWFRGELGRSDVRRLRQRLDRGFDQGAGATLCDIETSVSGTSELNPLLHTRSPIGGNGSVLEHHHGETEDLRLPERGAATHWVEAGSVAIPFRVHVAKSPLLIVALHGVLRRDKYVLPRFEWLNSLRPLGHSVISFGDPTMDLASMEGGWWLGTALMDAVPRMAEIVRRAADQLGAHDVVLTGSSMGGFGALQLGAFLPSATVVVFNPQTDLRKYHATRVARAAMGAVFGADGEPAEPRVDVAARYAQVGAAPTRIRYVTNVGDAHHIEAHFEPFAAALADRGCGSVIERSDRDDGPGHVKIPRDAFVSVITEETDRLHAARTADV